MCGQKTSRPPQAPHSISYGGYCLPLDMSDWSLNMGGKPSPRAGSQREKTLAEARNYSPDEIKVNDYFQTVNAR